MVGTATQHEALANVLAGRLLAPGDEGYDEARQVQNGMIDRHPALIARCLGIRDIVESVKYARTHGLEISVRGGGHNVAGRAVTEGGLMIDLAEMRAVVVDPARKVAVAQGGATWGDFYRETELYGLSTNGGVVSTTGVAGLTLGGGIGYLMGSHGLSIDNLRGVELVTAKGEVVRASAEESPDLFWALRGGGGNFGVAASLEFDLHEIPSNVIGGIVAHPFEAAGDVLRFYRDVTAAGVPDEMQLFSGVVHAPDGSGLKMTVIVCAHSGPAEEAEEALRPIREFGSPILDTVGPIPFSALNSMLDDGSPKGALNYWKSSFLSELSDEAIDTIIEGFSESLPPMNGALLEHLHGAATRVAPEATAFSHRAEGHNFLISGVWLDPSETETNIGWVRGLFDRMSPHFTDARYVNYVGDDEGQTAPDSAYGPALERLREVKRQYDPENLFHLNQNIVP
jgi:FAD/FMN-containing dehydrogenase